MNATLRETTVDEVLPVMQQLASQLWSPLARHHPGQLAWSARYADPALVALGPVALVEVDGVVAGWAWAEDDDAGEVCGTDPDVLDPALAWLLDRATGPWQTTALETDRPLADAARRAGLVELDQPWWSTHHGLDLGLLQPVPETGYRLRAVRPDETAARAACHRAAWSPPGSTSRVTELAYTRLQATAPYDVRLDHVAVAPDAELAASCLVWLDPTTGVALVEPVGCVPAHRGRGLAAAVSLSALHAAREAGATTALVCPRGDPGYPVPQRVYQGIGFVPGPRTRAWGRP